MHRTSKSTETGLIAVARSWGEEKMGTNVNGYSVLIYLYIYIYISIWGDKNVQELDSGDVCKTLWIY